jgi:hypothetical protein
MFNSSRILEGIANYIPSLDQGLAVLTNSTVSTAIALTFALVRSYAIVVAVAK